MDVGFQPTPHESAIALITGKPVVTRRVFDQLLPELRGRAFTVAGIESANALQRVRDAIAALPAGSTWREVKKDVAAELEPYLGDGAKRRAELLIRTHGFQAFQAANWQVAQQDEDTTHLQYLATEDDKVRDSHLALNGIILPKNDPFWDTHTPPWEWGCRCRIRPMNPDLVDEARAEDQQYDPDNRLVLEGPVAQRLREGQLVRDGRSYSVTPPSEKPGADRAFAWHPDDLRMPVGDMLQRYDEPTATAFTQWARQTTVSPGFTVWNWLNSRPAPKRSWSELARQDARARRKV